MNPEQTSCKPVPSRRRLFGWLLLVPALPGLFAARVVRAAAALRSTPADDWGPFYPLDWSGDIDADLTRFSGAAAEGKRLRVSGVVQDTAGTPLANAVIEIWQADTRGRYRHPGVPEQLRDRGFQGYGRTVTGADGNYAFLTVLPGRYGSRPPHVHFRVARPGAAEFVTQMYFRGDNREGGQGPGSSAPPEREALSVALKAETADSFSVRFNLALPRA